MEYSISCFGTRATITKMHTILLTFFTGVFLLSLAEADEYLDEVQEQCYSSKKVLSCAKYNLFQTIDNFNIHNHNLTSDSSVKFISIADDKNFDQPRARTLFPRARHLTEDSEFSKITKFFTRQVGKFFTEHGLAVELPKEAVVLEEGRKTTETGRKKKKELILPILILFKLFKVKILVALTLIGVFFIKKTILLAAFFLPSIVASIKQHCKAPHQFHVVPYHTEEEHYHHDHEHQNADYGGGVTGYGGDGGGGEGGHFWKPHKRRQYS